MITIPKIIRVIFLSLLTAGILCDAALAQSSASEDELKARIKELTLERTRLEEQVEYLRAENKKLDDKMFELLSGDFDTVSREILQKKFRDEKDELNTRVFTLREELKSLEQKLRDKERVVTENIEAIKHLERQLTKAADEKNDLQKTLSNYQSQIKGLEVQTEQRISGIRDSTQKEKNDIMRELQKVKESIPAQISDAKAGLQKKVEDLSKDLAETKSLLSQKEESISALSADKDSLTRNLQSARNEKVNLESQMKQRQEELSALKSSVPRQIQDARAPLETQIRKQGQDYEQMRVQFERKITEMQHSLRSEIKILEDQLASRQKIITQHEQDLAALKKAEKGLQQELAQIKVSTSKEMDKLSTDIKQKDAELGNRERLIKELNQSRDSLNKELAKTDAEVRSLRVELKASEMNMEQQEQSARTELAETKAAMGKEISALNKQVAHLNNEIPVKINEARAPLDTQIKRLTQSIQEKDKAINELTQQQQTRQEALQVAKSESKALREKLDGAARDLDAVKAGIPEQIRQATQPLEHRITLLTKNIETTQAGLNQKNAQFKDLEHVLAKAQHDHADTQKARAAAEAQYKQTSAQLKTLQDSIPAQIVKSKQPLETEIQMLKDTIAEKERLIPQKVTEAKAPLENKIAEMQTMVSALKLDLSEKDTRIRELTDNGNKQAQTISRLEKETDALKQQNVNTTRDWEKKLAASQKQTDDMAAVLQEKDTALVQLTKSIPAQIEAAKKPLTENITSLQAVLKEKDLALTQQIQLTEKSDGQKSVLNKQVGELSTEKAKLAAELDRTAKELDAVTKNIPERIAQAKVPLSKEITELKGELQKTGLTLAENEKQLGRLRQEKHNLQNDITALQKQMQASQERIIDAQKQFEQLQQSIPDAVKRAEEPLLKEITMLKARGQTAEAQYQQSLTQKQTEFNGKIKDLNESIRTKDAELKSLFSDLASARKETEKLKENLNASRNAKQAVDEKLAAISSEFLEIRNSIPTQIAQNTQPLTAKIVSLEKDLQNKENILKTRDATIAGLEQAVNGLQKNLSDSSREKESLVNELAGLNKRFETAAGQLKQKETILADSIKRIKSFETDVQQGQARERKLSTELTNISQQLADLQKSLPEKLAEARAPLENNLKTLNAQIKEQTIRGQEKTQMISQLEGERDKLNKSVEALWNKLEESKNEKDALIKEAAVLENKLKQAIEAIPQKITAAKQPLENQIAELNTRLKGEQAKLSDKENRIEMLSKERDQFIKSQNALDEKLKETLKEKELLQTKISTLGTQLDNVTKSIPQKVTEAKAPLEDRLSSANAQIKEKDAQVAGLLKERDQLTSSVNTLKNDLGQTVKEKGGLADTIAALNTQLENITKSIPQKIQQVQIPLEKTIDTLKGQLQAANTDQKEKNKEIEALLSKQKDLAQRLVDAKAENERLERETTAARESLRKTEAAVPGKINAVRQELVREIDQYKEQIKQNDAAFEKSSREIEALAKDRDALIDDLFTARAGAQKAQESLKIMEASLPKKLAAARAPLEEKIVAMEQSLGALNSQNAASVKQIKGLSESKAQLEQNITSLENKNQKLGENLVNVKGTLEEFQAALPQKIAEAKQPLEAKIISLEKDAATAQNALEQTQTALNTLRKEKDAALATAAQLEAGRNNLQADLNAVRGELAFKEKTLKQQESENEVLRRENSKVAQLLTQSEKKAAALASERDAAQKDLTVLQESVPQEIAQAQAPLKVQISALSKELDTTKNSEAEKSTRLKELVDEKNRLEKNIQSMGKDKEALLKDLTAAKAEIATMKTDLPVKIAQAKAPLEVAAKSLGEELSTVKNQLNERSKEIARLASVEKNLNTQTNRLEEEKNILSQKLSAMDEELKGVKAGVPAQIEQAKKPLLEEISMIRAKADQLSVAVNEKERALRQAEETVGSLQNTITKLNKTSGELDSALTASANELKALKDSIPAKINEVQAPLEKKLAGQTEEISRYQAVIREKEANIKEIDEQLRTRLKEIASLQETQKNLSGDLGASGKKLEQMQTVIAQKEKDIGQLQQVQAGLNQTVAFLEKEKAGLNAKLTDVTGQLVSTREDMNTLRATLAGTEEERKKLDASIPGRIAQAKAPLETKVETLSASLKAMSKEKEDVGVTLNRTQKELTASITARDKLKGELNEVQSAIPGRIKDATAPLNEQVTQLSAQLADSRKALKVGEENMRQLLQKQADLENVIKQLTDDKKSAEARATQVTAQLDSARLEKNSLTDNFNRLQTQFRETKESIPALVSTAKKPLEDRIALLSADTGKKDESISALRSEINQLKNNVKVSESRNVELAQEMAQAKNALETNLKKAQEETARQGALLEQKNAAIGQLQQKVEEQNTLVARLTGEQKSFSTQATNLKEELASRIEEKKALTENLSALKAELTEVRNSIPQIIAREKQPFQEKIAGLEAKVSKQDTIIKQYVRKEDNLKFMVEKNERAREELEQQLPKAIADAKHPLEKELAALGRQLTDRDDLIRQRDEAIRQMDEKQGRLVDEKSELVKQVQSLNGQLKQAEALIPQRVQETESRLNKEISTLSQRIVQQEATIGQKDQRMTSLSTEVQALKKKTEDYQQREKELGAQISQLTERETKLKDAIPQQIAEARVPLENENKQLQAELQKNRAALGERQNEITTLNEKRAALSTTVESLQNNIAFLENELKTSRQASASREKEHAGQMDKLRQDLAGQTANLQLELNKRDQALADKEKANNELLIMIEGFKSGLVLFEEREAQLAAERNVLNKQLQTAKKTAEEEKAHWQSIVSEKEGALKKEQARAASLEEIRSAQTQKQQALEQEKNSLKEQISSLEKQIDQSNKLFPEKVAEARKPLESKISTLEDQIALNVRTLKAMESSVNTLKEEKSGLSGETEKLRQEKNNIVQELQSAVRQLEETRRNMPQLIAQAKTPLEESVASLKQQLKQSQGAVPDAVAQATNPLKAQLAELQKQISTNERQMQLKTQKTEDLQKQLKELEGQAAQIQKSKDTLNAQHNTLLKELAELKTSSARQLKNSIDTYEDKIKTLTRDLQAAQNAMDSRLKELTALKDGQAKIENRLKTEMQKAQEELNTLRKEKNSLQEALNALKDKLDQVRSEMAAREIDLQERDKLNQELRGALELINTGY